jgi:hypothetical protein
MNDTTMNTATLVRTGLLKGNANLYRVDPPVTYEDYDKDAAATTEYVIVSAAVVPYSGPETYIFPANASGEVTDWGELDGSYKGGLDHDEALRGAGYEVRP